MGVMIVAAVIFSLGACLAASLPLFLVSEAVMLERAGALRSLARSFELIISRSPKGFFNPANHSIRLSILLLLILVLNVMAMLASRIPFAVWGIVDALRQGGGLRTFAETLQSFQVASSLLGLFASCLVQPVGIAALVLFYYDLRVRTEGFDLELLARELGHPQRAQRMPQGMP